MIMNYELTELIYNISWQSCKGGMPMLFCLEILWFTADYKTYIATRNGSDPMGPNPEIGSMSFAAIIRSGPVALAK